MAKTPWKQPNSLPLPTPELHQGTPGLQGEGNALWIQQLPVPLSPGRLKLHRTELSQLHKWNPGVTPGCPTSHPFTSQHSSNTPASPEAELPVTKSPTLLLCSVPSFLPFFFLKKYSALFLIICIIYNNYMPILISGLYSLDVAAKSKAVLCGK